MASNNTKLFYITNDGHQLHKILGWCLMGSIPRTNFIFRFEYFFDLSPRMNANTTQTQLSSSFYISPITYL
ncbi:hypothetical protein DERP_012510 [Dermatophagoides pteronyssinus]|uniref:Uncharacterized protein n=1 Tax=Dermatophagoides pteronyssinus TaxID=6956 RepID=A0ABQ8IX80_DERPT|nr:hypothetical protein DERP_012510 [Dermatophagoides pteronyssinus]